MVKVQSVEHGVHQNTQGNVCINLTTTSIKASILSKHNQGIFQCVMFIYVFYTGNKGRLNSGLILSHILSYLGKVIRALTLI